LTAPPIPLTINVPNDVPTIPPHSSTTDDYYSLFDPAARGRTNKEIRIQNQNETQNSHIGDIMSEKPDGTTRIYVQNINGINLRDKGFQFKEICEDMQLIQANIRGEVLSNTTWIQPNMMCDPRATALPNKHSNIRHSK
jgi:hypothetical protein